MKKFLSVLAALLIMSTAVVYAAQNSSSRHGTKIVIIGGAEYKTSDYYKIARNSFGKGYEAGEEIQDRYQTFMMERHDVGEDTPHKQDFIDFTAQNDYDSVVFLIVSEKLDTQNNAKSRQKNRITVQINAYLASGARILDVTTVSRDDTSKTSNLRARRSAFKKCVREVAKKFKSE